MNDTVWIKACPLPMIGLFTDTCECGKKFRGRDRRLRYEVHWRREHEISAPNTTQVSVTREEADALYARVGQMKGAA